MPTPRRRPRDLSGRRAPPPCADINLDDLKPGLVATHADAGRGQYVALEPTVAVALGPGEASHPRLVP